MGLRLTVNHGRLGGAGHRARHVGGAHGLYILASGFSTHRRDACATKENGKRQTENGLMPSKILDLAREVLTIEAEGLTALIQKLDVSFVKAVDLMFLAKGRVIVTGVGKSGIVARKLVATFNSTGTPALFLHPVEAMHGDLGMVSAADVVLALSNSGETRELTILIPSLERLQAPLIATDRPARLHPGAPGPGSH